VVDEGNPRFLGVYTGAFSEPRTRLVIDEANLLIRAGVLLADTTSGGFTHASTLNPASTSARRPRRSTGKCSRTCLSPPPSPS